MKSWWFERKKMSQLSDDLPRLLSPIDISHTTHVANRTQCMRMLATRKSLPTQPHTLCTHHDLVLSLSGMLVAIPYVYNKK